MSVFLCYLPFNIIKFPTFCKFIISIIFHLQLEQKVTEIEQFYLTTSKKLSKASKSSMTVKDKEKHIPSIKKLQQDASRREAVAMKRMQELMRQFGTILRQVIARNHYVTLRVYIFVCVLFGCYSKLLFSFCRFVLLLGF